MMYLVIVESPSKCEKIKAYLNDMRKGDFRVEASMGHIRTLMGLKSINIAKDFQTTFSLITGKQQVITKLKKAMTGRQVILATDPDREGEGIAYHVAECLGIPIQTARRMTFNEITKTAVQRAFANQRGIDMDLVNAQKTRQILDLLVGYELSPILWMHIAPKLSAGRCQSPALRLIADRETAITKALEGLSDDSKTIQMSADFRFGAIELQGQAEREYPVRPEKAYLDVIETAHKFKYKASADKPQETMRQPPAPFTTSTIQQEASRRFGMSPGSTMKVLQKLYEAGRITYMRTDSTTIAPDAIQEIKGLVEKKYGREYSQPRPWGDKKAVSAQEAHECIRPTHPDDMPASVVYTDDQEDDVSTHHSDAAGIGQKLYDMIWCRTVASQMTAYREEQTRMRIVAVGTKTIPTFLATAQKTTHLGWKRVYDMRPIDTTRITGAKEGTMEKIVANETLARIQGHYDEASLIRELERLGIGRPSTYSGIVETLGERGYIVKESRQGRTMELRAWEKTGSRPTETSTKPTQVLNEKNKMYLTDLGNMVNQFLTEKFQLIMDYKYTAHIEERLDGIAKGADNWVGVARDLYQEFHPIVVSLKKTGDKEASKEQAGKDKTLGKHPETHTPVYIEVSPRSFRVYQQNPSREAWLKRGVGVEEPTLETAVDLLKYPKELGVYKSKPVVMRRGPYGYYLEWDGRNFGLSKDINADEVDIAAATATIEAKENRIIKEFKSLSILNGPYGAYIRKGKANYSIPKDIDPSQLTLKRAEEIIQEHKDKPKSTFKYRPKTSGD